MCRQIDAVLRRGVVEQPYEEQDGAGDVDEGVYAVCPVHEEGVAQEPCLDLQLVEYVEVLFEVDQLEGVAAGNCYCAFDHCHCGEGSAELVDLKFSTLV